MGFKITEFQLSLPFGIGGFTVKRTQAQLDAAWNLYVEYATRIATQPLEAGQGSMREALSSLYALFDVTRSVLKQEGPGVAQGPQSIGPLAIRILNDGVRPFLVKWHTRLSAFESAQTLQQRQELGPDVVPIIDESKWELADVFYDELNQFRLDLLQYVEALGDLAGVNDE